MKTDDRAVVMILLVGEASGVFAGFCPSWFTVASPFFHEQEAKAGNIKRIMAGEKFTGQPINGNRRRQLNRPSSLNFPRLFFLFLKKLVYVSKTRIGIIREHNRRLSHH